MDLSPVMEAYARDGYARLGRVATDAALDGLRTRATELMLGQVEYPGLFFQMDAESGEYADAPLGLGYQGPSLNYRKLEKLELDERFRAWMRNSLFERVARALITGPVVSYRAILFNKGAQVSSEIPWHQDGGKLWGLSADPTLQIWTALDDAPVGGGCLEFVPGTHRAGLVTPLGGVVGEEFVARGEAEAKAVPVPAVAGEAVLVHNHVWHRSGRSRKGQRRLGFSVCLMSASVRCLRKKRAPRVFFPVFS